MAISPKAKAATNSDLAWSGAKETYDAPPRYRSPLGDDVKRVAQAVADEWHRQNPDAPKPKIVQMTDDALTVARGLAAMGATLREERPDPLASFHKEWKGAKTLPEDEAFYSKPADPKGTVYAIGPIDQEHDPGFKAGPWPRMPELNEWAADVGDALFRWEPNKEPEILDVWVEARMIGGVRYVPGWAVNTAREECYELMAKAAAPKKNFGAAAQASAPSRPAPPARPQRQTPVTEESAAEATAEGLDGTNGAEETKIAKRPKGAAPVVQEGESLDDLKHRAQATAGERETVFVAVGKTINIGDYESVRIDVGYCRPVEDGQSREDATNAVIDDVFETLNQLKADVLAAVQGGNF